MAKKTRSSDKNDHVEILHSALTFIEGMLLDSPNSSIEKINETIERAELFFKKNPDIATLPKDKKREIEKIFAPSKIFANTYKKDPQYAQKRIIELLHKTRKKIDKEYIENLLNTSTTPKEETINQARNFFIQIKKSDPLYFEDMVSTTLKIFKEIPQKLNYDMDDLTKIYSMTNEDIEKIKKTRDIINQIIPGYKIEQKEQESIKPYAIAFMDRVLFNGAINKADYADKDSKYPTSKETIDILEAETKENGLYAKNKTAKAFITLFKEYMKKNKLEKKPFPQLINYMISSYQTKYSYKGKSISFQIVDRDKNGVYSYQTNQYLKDFYFSITNNILKTSDINAGEKYKYREQIEKNDVNLALMCEGAEQYLLHQCEQHGLNKNIIYHLFGREKLDANNKIKPNYHKNLYHFLTTATLTVKDNKKTINTTMFTPSLHHDKIRIHTDLNPNNSPNNFILTLIPSEKVSFLDIYERFIHSLELSDQNEHQLDPKIIQEEREKVANLRKSKIKTPNVHHNILHAADLNIHSTTDTSDRYLQFLFTPTTDEQNPKTNYVVAITHSASPIYKEKTQTMEDMYKQISSSAHTYINSQKALRR